MRFAALVLFCLVSATSFFAASNRPNFLFIYTDDQRYDALGVVQREQGERGRFPWLQTPNLDRIAAEGVRFRNAFVVNALCSPSRAVFLTGRYNHLNGVANNHTPFPTNNVTHASLLRDAGYATAYIGKWHMDSQRGARPGFTYSASYIAHGRYQDCPFQINGFATNTTGWVDDVSTDLVINFLKEHRDKPFLVVLGYKSPHGPFEPPERWNDKLTNVVSRPPPNGNAPPPYLQRSNLAARPVPARQAEMHRKYFRTISAVDENVGRILKALDDMELAENTMLIYASDNGFYLGEHGLGDKRSAYEESIRIPLLLRYPKLGARGRLIDSMVLNLDLAPTLLDFAGLAITKEMQGRSWKPLLSSVAPLPDWRKSFFYEYFVEIGVTGRQMGPPSMTALRTDSAKLIKYPGHDDWTELFDLRADPYETNNLAQSSARRDMLQIMQTEYDRQAKAVEFRVPPYADVQPTPSPQ
ncbi:MAG TPA: sulfatase [Candidatus Binatia bacterium]|nr:sulfatase [Candidatus Binatia bacterium]